MSDTAYNKWYGFRDDCDYRTPKDYTALDADSCSTTHVSIDITSRRVGLIEYLEFMFRTIRFK